MAGRNTGGLGGRMALARQRRGLSQRDVAQTLGVRASHLSRWENGRVAPRAEVLAGLAGVCRVSLTWLITGDGSPEPLCVFGQQDRFRGKGYFTSAGFLSQAEVCSRLGIRPEELAGWLMEHRPDGAG